MDEVEKFTERFKGMKEVHKKSKGAIIALWVFGYLLFFAGFTFMLVVYSKDSESIKMTTTLPIFLITAGIGLVRESYKDS